MIQNIAARALFSVWSKVPLGAADPILGVASAFRADKDPKKVNLSIGAYRDNTGAPVVLPSVNAANKIIVEKVMDNEYLPVEGLLTFVEAANKLALGGQFYDANRDRIAGTQVLSGTGACRLAFAFFERFLPKGTNILIPNPTWPNHLNIAKDAHLPYKEYRYFDPSTKGVDFNGLVEDLNKANVGDVVLFHACAHNPTGCDLTMDQWMHVQDVVLRRKLLPFFDMAYQGFTSGDTDRDAGAVRLFSQNMPVVVAQSFAKNMGLYGQRCGNLAFTTADAAEKERVLSQLRLLSRPIWSNPPLHGARVADIILNTPSLNKQWLQEVRDMATRISQMRAKLTEELKNNGSVHDWSHIQKQIGMFAFTGLKPEHVKVLVEKYHIYLLSSGRISIAGLNDGNVKYVAEAFDAVTRGSSI